MKYNEGIYVRTLKLIMLRAGTDIFKDTEIEIRHTVNHSLYCELLRKEEVTVEEIKKMKDRMDEIIAADYPITLLTANMEHLKRRGESLERPDIRSILETTAWMPIREYELDGYRDYYYDKLHPTTGGIYLFDMEKYADGFLIKYPLEESQKELHKIEQMPKLVETLKIGKYWEKKMGVSSIGQLNEKILKDEGVELIRISETLHEAKLAKIAADISSSDKYKLVTIAGPSSSGKTTFSNKLLLFLKANGLNPVLISLDSYYKGRAYVPLDENGQKDFESIDGLDLELLNNNLKALIKGEEVEIPEYDFVLGERKSTWTKMKLPQDGIVIIEGIHGLNEKLTSHISREEKYKIYISCLTQLNIDLHNRIPTSEVRKIRRIVRDSMSRGTSVESTLEMWKSVRRGEEKNIFPYQEEADVMFNSNLVYELAVLKPYAIKELIKIKIDSPHYDEAKTLIRILSSLVDIDDKFVPDTSILKEFIGGSYFYNY